MLASWQLLENFKKVRQKLYKGRNKKPRRLLSCPSMCVRTRLLLSNLFWALSHQWDERTWSVLFWAGSHRMKGCVCFCWTCCNGHIPVGGGLCWAITWPRGAYAFTQHTQGLSRHVSHSQSYSTDWAEVRWGGTGVRRGKEEGRCGQTAKIGCYVRDGETGGSVCCATAVGQTGKSRREEWRRSETSIAVFGQRCCRYLLAFVWGVASICPSCCLSGPSCSDGAMVQIVEWRGKSDAQLWNLKVGGERRLLMRYRWSHKRSWC